MALFSTYHMENTPVRSKDRRHDTPSKAIVLFTLTACSTTVATTVERPDAAMPDAAMAATGVVKVLAEVSPCGFLAGTVLVDVASVGAPGVICQVAQSAAGGWNVSLNATGQPGATTAGGSFALSGTYPGQLTATIACVGNPSACTLTGPCTFGIAGDGIGPGECMGPLSCPALVDEHGRTCAVKATMTFTGCDQ